NILSEPTYRIQLLNPLIDGSTVSDCISKADRCSCHGKDGQDTMYNFKDLTMNVLDSIFTKLLLPVYVLFIVFLRSNRLISRARFECLLLNAPEKMSNRCISPK
ncbi:hypothetical protein, partial [Nitrosomonas supralitoralis]|uniref:hypothetical protein n=1 Tax=Nitrosomonas supralitoralis TaxID=2116706 RepID=UPI001A8C3E2E